RFCAPAAGSGGEDTRRTACVQHMPHTGWGLLAARPVTSTAGLAPSSPCVPAPPTRTPTPGCPITELLERTGRDGHPPGRTRALPTNESEPGSIRAGDTTPPAPNASAPCSQLVTEPACDLTHEGFGLGLNQGRDPGLCQRGDREQLSVRMLHDADFVPQIQQGPGFCRPRRGIRIEVGGETLPVHVRRHEFAHPTRD